MEVLHWAVEIGRVDALLEVSMMSEHLVLPRQIQLKKIINIFSYLEHHKKSRLVFDSDHPKISLTKFKTYD